MTDIITSYTLGCRAGSGGKAYKYVDVQKVSISESKTLNFCTYVNGQDRGDNYHAPHWVVISWK